MPSVATANLARRFWAKVDRRPGHGPNGDCWEWKGARFRDGYGMFMRGRDGYGRPMPAGAHRVAYELTHGDIPAGLHICHRCDHRPCVCPAHLFAGTPADNMADMQAKGRGRGRRSGRRLTEDQVLAIRMAAQDGTPQRTLAQQYGITESSVSHIVTRKTWADLPDAPRLTVGGVATSCAWCQATVLDRRDVWHCLACGQHPALRDLTCACGHPRPVEYTDQRRSA